MRHGDVRVHELPERVVVEADTERERDRVRQRMLLELRLAHTQHVRVDGRPERDGRLRAVAHSWLPAAEELDATLDPWHLRLAADEHDLVDVGPFEPRDLPDGPLGDDPRAVERWGGTRFHALAGHVDRDVERGPRAEIELVKRDGRRGCRRELLLRALRREPQPRAREHIVRPYVLAGPVLDLTLQGVRDSGVDVIAAELRVAVDHAREELVPALVARHVEQ